MKILIKNTIILFFFFLIHDIHSQSCTCPANASPPSVLANKSSTYSPQAVVINGVNYGVPRIIGNLIYLVKDFVVYPSILSLNTTCPTGWRPPTYAELNTVLTSFANSSVAYTNLISTSGFTAAANIAYMTSQKDNNITDPNNSTSFNYEGMFIDAVNKKAYFASINTYFSKTMAVKCVWDDTALDITVPAADPAINTGITLSSATQNLVSYLWVVNSKQATTTTYSVTITTPGCYTVQLWAKNLINNVDYNCKVIWIQNNFGSNYASSLSLASIQSVNLGIKANVNLNLFLNNGNGPIAAKSLGGFYLAYSDMGTNTVHVLEFDANYNMLVNRDLQMNVLCMDIVATEWGFVIYAKYTNDTNHAFLAGYNSDYSNRFTRTLMNNGQTPSSVTNNANEVSFYSSNGVRVPGTEVMFAANNGKLSYGRGRIGLIFAHYNYFGLTSVGTRIDHTGDTYYSFDSNGQNERYAWGWLTSHSLYQSHYYNGQYFITAALGDDYQENITFCIVDGFNTDGFYDPVRQGYFRHPKLCWVVIPGNIPGDGAGHSCGRLGGIHQFGSTFALVYSRKPCTTINAEQVVVTNTVNELAVISFNIVNGALTNFNKKTILPSADYIMAVRSVKYGNKILVNYAVQNTSAGQSFDNAYFTGSEGNYFLLTDITGTLYTNPFKYSALSTPTSDDIVVLQNGQVVWANVDVNNNLSIYYANSNKP
jgi:hypothetical protein